MKRVLVACEESQEVCKAFRALGIEAFSCDLVPCSGGHPEWHIQYDALEVAKGGLFLTNSGEIHYIEKWDLIIAHPPCTYLTITGNRWFNEEKLGEYARERKQRREEAVEFFMAFANLDCPLIAIENPIGHMSTVYRKPDQIIEPWQFGHETTKKTCLWLKGLPLLKPTNIVSKGEFVTWGDGKKKMSKWYRSTWNLPRDKRAKARSKTFEGIALAMASQWGEVLLREELQ